MKQRLLKTLIITCLSLPIFAYSAEKILVSGQSWKNIAIIDKDSNTIEWTMTPPGAKVINCISMDKEGNILLAGQNKLMKISRDKKVLWEYPVAEDEETHFIKELDNGNYLIGICGAPSRIIEMDKNEKILKTITFETGQTRPHSQFRHVNLTKDGNYLVTVLKGNEIIEIDPKGEILSRDKVDLSISVFGTIELKNGNLLTSADAKNPKATGLLGAGRIVEYDRKTKEVLREMNTEDLAFPCQVIERDNGNLVVANWNGHSKDKSKSKIIEIDKNNNIVWALKDIPQIRNIASIYLFDE